MVEIELPSGVRYPLGAKPLYCGRAPTNDVVVDHATVSGRHMALWVASGQIWVEDLRSRNGTQVDGVPLTGMQSVLSGAQLIMGEAAALRVLGDPETLGGLRVPVLEDLGSGVRHPVHSDRFRVGDQAGVDLRVPGVATHVLMTDAAGGLAIGQPDDEVALVAPATPFALGDHRFIIRLVDAAVAETREVLQTQYRYRVQATLNGPTGALAVITDPETAQSLEVQAQNRAALLYLLARQLQHDRVAGVEADDAGWCTDTELIRGLWGKAEVETHRNNLAVLVCRTRRQVREAGLDPWFIEKRQRHIRVRAAMLRLD